jgi:hypothetical protein
VTEKLLDGYPIAIVQDRYSGVYSGGAWLAVAQANLPHDGRSRIDFILGGSPHGDDSDAAEFWAAPPDWIAVGNSPQRALDNLLRGIRADDACVGHASGEF